MSDAWCSTCRARRIVDRRHGPTGCSGDVLRHARRRVDPPRCPPRCRRPRFAQHADGAGPRRARRGGPARRPRRAGGGVRRPRSRAGRHARRAAVHQRDGGGQLPSGRRRSRAVERADDRRHGRSSAGAPRRRGRPDRRPERSVRPGGALVSRPGHRRRRRRGSWRSLGRRCFAAAATGPVHLNLPFREPFLGEIAELPQRYSAPDGASAWRPLSPDAAAPNCCRWSVA